MNNRDFDIATDECRTSVQLVPNETESHILLGLALAQKHDLDLDGAISEFSEAVRLKDNSLAVHTGLCVAYRQKGMFREAANECQKAVDLAPNDQYLRGELKFVKRRSH